MKLLFLFLILIDQTTSSVADFTGLSESAMIKQHLKIALRYV